MGTGPRALHISGLGSNFKVCLRHGSTRGWSPDTCVQVIEEGLGQQTGLSRVTTGGAKRGRVRIWLPRLPSRPATLFLWRSPPPIPEPRHDDSPPAARARAYLLGSGAYAAGCQGQLGEEGEQRGDPLQSNGMGGY